MDKVKSHYKYYKLYPKIQQDSKDLSQQLKKNMKNFSPGGQDIFIKRNVELVTRHLKQVEAYIQ